MRRPARRTSIIIPLLFLGAFLYMVNREKTVNRMDYRRDAGGNPQAMERDLYPKGVEGTAMRLDDGLQEANAGIRNIEREKRDVAKQIEDVDAWLAEFKNAYKSANTSSTWPVPVRGKSYSEDQLTSKVQSLFNIKTSLEERLSLKDQQIAAAQKSADGISKRLDEIRAQMAKEATEREREKLKEYMQEADKYVDDRTVVLPKENDNPIRSLDDLIKAEESKDKGIPASWQALNFLKDPK